MCGHASGDSIQVGASMGTAKRTELARLAVEKTIGVWAYGGHGARHIVIDDTFEKNVAMMVDILDQQVGELEAFFLSLEDEDLQAICRISSSVVLQSIQDELMRLVRSLNRRLKGFDRFHHMAIGAYPHERADYKMWANNDSYSEPELVWLSIGLEPTEEVLIAYQNYKNGRGGIAKYIGSEADRRLQIIGRSRTLGTYGQKRADGEKALTWITSIDLGTPKGFLDMLSKSAGRVKSEEVLDHQSEAPVAANLDGRERVAMSKLLAAMAIDAYGFDPSAKRSDIPKEIEGIVDRLGLSLSTNTIRKYLRQGSELLPEDWEPE